MDFDTYQKQSRTTAVYPNIGSNYVYPTLGLVGESGEVAEKVKKLIRDSNASITPEFKEMIKKELGDVLWYLAQLSSEFGLSLDDVADHNLKKLADRKERGVLHGSGDMR